jgi:hypothetical protein
MSRGPGVLQRRVLETLATYQRIGASLQWTWPGGRRYALATYAGASDIDAYEQGRRVPVRTLRRDLECTRAELSRALSSLHRQGFVRRFDWDLQMAGERFGAKNCKFACITDEGENWLKCQQIRSAEVGT